MKKPKVAIFLNYPAHYTDGVLKCLLADERINLDVIYYNGIPTDHKEWNREQIQDEHIFYCRKRINVIKGEYYNPEAIRWFKERKYDLAIISGRMPFTSYHLLKLCQRRSIPYIFAADTALMPLESEVRDKDISRKKYRKIISNAKAIWTPGRAGMAYWKALFADEINDLENRMIEGKYLLDGSEISVSKNSEYIRKEIRGKLGISDGDFVILFVGRLNKDRDVRRLMRIHESLLQENKRYKLLVIGYGEETQFVKEYHRRHPEDVWHIESVPYSKLNDYYVSSDLYTHPGREPYSLALVQAVYNNLPVVSSDQVGAVYDYIVDGVNGLITSFADDMGFIEAIRSVFQNGLDMNSSVAVSRRIFRERSCELIAERITDKIWEVA